MKKITLLFALILTMASYAQTPGGGLTDVDGNTYSTVIIGTQEWMQTNYNVSKFTDGTPIPEITNAWDWNNCSSAAWSNYNNDITNGNIYGKLYNYPTLFGIYDNASSPNISLRKKFAPTGWHVPTPNEWLTLITYLGNVAKMKESGTSHWNAPNTGTNESGFTGLPGGERTGPNGSVASFNYLGSKANWFELNSQSITPTGAVVFTIYNNNNNFINQGVDSCFGYSVRLIKDSPLNNQSFINDSFNIYPNPAKEQITIDCGDITNVSGLSYKIINTLGQEIINGKLSSQQNIIPLNQLKGQGIYFVKILNEQNEVLSIKKIIVQ